MWSVTCVPQPGTGLGQVAIQPPDIVDSVPSRYLPTRGTSDVGVGLDT